LWVRCEYSTYGNKPVTFVHQELAQIGSVFAKQVADMDNIADLGLLDLVGNQGGGGVDALEHVVSPSNHLIMAVAPGRSVACGPAWPRHRKPPSPDRLRAW